MHHFSAFKATLAIPIHHLDHLMTAIHRLKGAILAKEEPGKSNYPNIFFKSPENSSDYPLSLYNDDDAQGNTATGWRRQPLYDALVFLVSIINLTHYYAIWTHLLLYQQQSSKRPPPMVVGPDLLERNVAARGNPGLHAWPWLSLTNKILGRKWLHLSKSQEGEWT